MGTRSFDATGAARPPGAAARSGIGRLGRGFEVGALSLARPALDRAGRVAGILAAAVAAGIVMLSAFVPTLRMEGMEVPSPAATGVIQTCDILAVGLIAVLFTLRFRRFARVCDLRLACALGLNATTGLLFTLTPTMFPSLQSGAVCWAGLTGHAIGWLGVLAAACGSRRRAERHVALSVLATSAVAVALVVLAFGFGSLLPAFPGLPRGATSGQSAAIILHAAIALFAGLAALILALDAAHLGDRFLRCFAAAAGFAALASIAYCASPAFTPSTISAVDFFRAGVLASLVAGVLVQISAYEREARHAGAAHERRRVGADIHDLVMQDLCFALSTARTLEATEPGAKATVEANERALAAARTLVRGVLEVDRAPLHEALRAAIDPAARRLGSDVQLTMSGRADAHPATREAMIGIVREAVTNAAKHARPSSVEVSVNFAAGWRVIVRDDGCGFDSATLSTGFGLDAMRDRAEFAGGSLQVRSASGQGTVVEAILP